MQFNIYQQEKATLGKKALADPSKKKAPKRVIKAEYKGIKYEAKSNAAESIGKEQASDYYVTIFDSQKNQAYAIKVESAF